MIIPGIFVFLVCGSVLTSASIYGVAIDSSEEWWLNSIFLKFYSPSGKNYCIDYIKGEIYLERLNPLFPNEEAVEKVDTPYISFVSLNLKIYNIFFELRDNNYVPHIVPTKFILDDKSTFIRHSLHSFVGPNKQVYSLFYNNNISNISISSALSPVETLPNHSIPLPEMESSILKDRDLLLVNYNTPSGTKYLITKDLNIASGNGPDDGAYIEFIEPNGREYEIFFRIDGNGHIPYITRRDNQNELKDEFGLKVTRLFSFVGPDKKQYRIDHTNQSEIPLIVDCEPNLSTDFQITLLVTSTYYRKYVKFIFSNQGKELFDRVEEFDWQPISDQPEIQIDEVEANSDIANSSFLTFYSPSGKIYYITPNDAKANIAVEKSNNESYSHVSYIRFSLQDGRTSSIYFTPGDVPHMEINSDNLNQSATIFSLNSFVAPDKKSYKMGWMVENGIRVPFIDLTSQPKDPLDEKEEDSLRITVMDTAREFNYHFTWTGEKVIRAFSRPLRRISSRVVASLIGK